MTNYRQLAQRALRAFLGSPLELSLLVAATVAVASAGYLTLQRSTKSEQGDDLTYRATVDSLSSLISQRGPDRIAVLRRGEFVSGLDTVLVDTLVVTADSMEIPSLRTGGFLRDQVSLFNDYAVRRAALQADPAWRQSLESPSMFRAVWSDSGVQVLANDANPYTMTIRSPNAEETWRTVRTRDWNSHATLIGNEGRITLTSSASQGARGENSRARLNGKECELRSESLSRQLVYCTNAMSAASGRFFDVGFVLRAGSEGTSFDSAFSYRDSRIWLNGRNQEFGRRRVRAGDLLDADSFGPIMLTRSDWGTLATAQWINGSRTFANQSLGTIGFFARAGRSIRDATASPAALRLSLDATLAVDLDEEAARFFIANKSLLSRMAVVVLDIQSGEIRTIAEPSRTSVDDPLTSFEPLHMGSAVKPIIASAVLLKQPGLSQLRLPYAGPVVAALAGVSLRKPFANDDNGCRGDIDFDDFVRCSSNQYAAELLVRSLQASASASGKRLGQDVPQEILVRSDFGSSLATMFDVDPGTRRTKGRLSLYWSNPALLPADAVSLTRDRSLMPFESRPWLSKPNGPTTPVDLLARYAFGGWDNKWTLLGLAQSYARIATGREVQATFLGTSGPTRGLTPSVSWDSTSNAFARVRRALVRVGVDGTAGGLTGRLQANIGTSMRVLAKTGTLNEPLYKNSKRGLYIKSLVIAVGTPTTKADDAPLECGLVVAMYFQFHDDWKVTSGRAVLPSLNVEFAKEGLSATLKRQWAATSGCPQTLTP